MSREAMKLALEALEVLGWQPTEEAMDYRDNAITALREALAEQALDKMAENARELGLDYEPIQCPICKAEDSPYPKCGCVTYVEQPAQQEPVAYLCENAVGHKYFRWKKPSSTYKPIALYTTPPAQLAVPDAIGPDEDELPSYAAGWNDCRQLMLEMRKP